MPKRKSNDPFGLGSFSSVDSLNDGVSGFNKRNTLGMNKMRGAMAEDSFAMGQRIQGHEVTRIHKGGDFVVQKLENLPYMKSKQVTLNFQKLKEEKRHD